MKYLSFENEWAMLKAHEVLVASVASVGWISAAPSTRAFNGAREDFTGGVVDGAALIHPTICRAKQAVCMRLSG